MMRLLMAAALCAAQVATAAQAAGIPDERGVVAQQRGTFAGARFRVRFGGREAGKARLSLSLAPVDRSRLGSGGERLHFGEGVELALRKGEPVELRLGGARLADRLGAISQADAERKQRKTGKVILKGAAIVAITAVAVVGGLFLFYSVACSGNRCDD